MSEVGYKRPPVKSRFAKGQSGNPLGRPKGHKNLRTILSEELSAKIPIRQEGKTRKLTAQQILVKQLLQKALTGDLKATDMVLRLIGKVDPNHAAAPETKPLAEHEQAALESYLNRLLRSRTA